MITLGYWKNKKQCDLRDDKFLHIQKQLNYADFSFLLGVDFKNKEFFIINVNNTSNIKYTPFHYAYRKPAYSILLHNIPFKPFTIENLSDEIKKILS